MVAPPRQCMTGPRWHDGHKFSPSEDGAMRIRLLTASLGVLMGGAFVAPTATADYVAKSNVQLGITGAFTGALRDGTANWTYSNIDPSQYQSIWWGTNTSIG